MGPLTCSHHHAPTYSHIGATGTADHLTLLRLFIFLFPDDDFASANIKSPHFAPPLPSPTSYHRQLPFPSQAPPAPAPSGVMRNYHKATNQEPIYSSNQTSRLISSDILSKKSIPKSVIGLNYGKAKMTGNHREKVSVKLGEG